MRQRALVRVLRSTAAIGAVALGSATANAACTTANGVVTCTGANTTNDTNNAIDRTPPPSVSVEISPGATVTRGFLDAISVSGFRFGGAIGYTNSGIVGTAGSNVDFRYFGNINDTGNPANSFTLDNRGTQNGRISAIGVGGAISGTNSGTVTGGIDLRNAGAISFTNTGSVFTNSNSFGDAIILSSLLTRSQTGADGSSTRTDTGGPVNAVIGGTVGFTGATGVFRPQGIFAGGVGGVDVTVNGRTGFVQATSGGTRSTSRSTSSTSGGVQTFERTFSTESIGGDARVTIAGPGRVTSVSVSSGPGTATAIVNGEVGSNTDFGSVRAAANGMNTTFTEASSSLSRLNSSAQINTGGAATVEISAAGRVFGSVSATSNAGAATVLVAGVVGGTSSLSDVFTDASGINRTSQNRSSGQGNNSAFSSSLTQALSGGAALTTIATTGDVSGGVRSRGDVSVTIDNSGRVRNNLLAISGTDLTTASASDVARTTITNAAGVRTDEDVSNSTSTSEKLGGTATINNRLGATVGADVQAFGVRGVTLINAGSITDGIFLSSSGVRSVFNGARRTVTTAAPATGGGTTTTIVSDSVESRSSRATGGAVSGTYSGTVGRAQPRPFEFRSVQQSGTTASTAAVTGTLFANFSGTAGGQNRDTATTSNSRRVTQPEGSMTREESSTSSETVAQVASTSSLTIGATGRIADNGSESGNVVLTSLGGNASFTLDGGRVDGGVTVEAAAGTNLTQTSSASATFTRGPSAPNTFVPEVQQSRANSSTLDERQAPGTAIVTVNGGTIGGDLLAVGSGTGAGSLGANVVMNGTVTGELIALSTGANIRRDTNSVATRTAPNAVTGTSVTNTLSSPSENGGGVLVAVGGTVGGGLVAGTDTSNATVNLTGSVGSSSADGVTVLAFDFTSRNQTTTNSAGTSFFNLRPTSLATTSSSEASGGAATLNVAANAAVRTAGTSSVEGDIFVQGFAGSALNVAAGSRIVQGTGDVFVGVSFRNSTTTGTATFANGVQTGSTATTTSTVFGGPASINNAGVIGSSANPTIVSVASIGGATLTNTGTINGSVVASARSSNQSVTTTTTDLNDFDRRRSVSTEVLTAVGGSAAVNNSSLITGGVTAIGATGTVTNSGVIRNGVTLGGSFSNFSTTTTTTNTATETGGSVPVTVISPSVANAALFTQNYTLNQNGLLLGGVTVTGTTTVDPSRATVRTSNVNAALNLNNGSITLGNITGGPDTNTNLNLNGSGFLGVAANDFAGLAGANEAVIGFLPTPSLTRFIAIDSALGSTIPLPQGSRVSGVRTLTKSGDGTFVIVGAPLLTSVGTAPPSYTLDVGTLRVAGGELQLGLAGATATANSFGIRGNVENNANLVLGRRITDGSQTAIQGINISVLGNVTNAAAGTLIVGANPAFARATAPVPGANPFAGTPLPFVAFGPSSPGLVSTGSFVRVDGNLNLAGTVAVQGQSGTLYEAGRAYDLFSVSGSYSNTGTVRSSFASPFVGFTLTPRSEGGRTIVSLDVVRTSFETGATDRNSAAAAGALQASLPSIFAGIRGGSPSADIQDLATIVAALDTQLTADQGAQLFREISSGEFYGSLSAISTTMPFGEATDGLPGPGAASGLGLWLRPTGQFATYRANREAGASEIDLGNHGGSVGLNYATGNGGNFGIAAGYGRLDVDSDGLVEAEAETYMVGAYGVQQIGPLHLSAQAVYGRSDWTASRTLPLLARTATSEFDSDEIRGSVRIAYTLAMLPGIDFSPFARAEVRRYSFDAFTEQGAGAVTLDVGKRSKTVFSPEVGARMSGSLGASIRPFAEASYIFQGDVGSDRDFSFAGGDGGNFTLQGVEPGDSIKGAVGVAADVGRGTIFIRGDYHSGGRQQVGSVRGGLLFTF